MLIYMHYRRELCGSCNIAARVLDIFAVLCYHAGLGHKTQKVSISIQKVSISIQKYKKYSQQYTQLILNNTNLLRIL